MRYLNKVIFINSAHVPYAEIKLDGNVHFIGTQGVGKSTLLRAILFFYNANKSRLGIGPGQRKFDDFYLPNPDSYMIYEVSRENGPFCVLLANRQGRAAYRIIDCAYDKRYFIRDDGSVIYEWGKISQLIGPHVFKSNTIRQYETFLNILYGNTAQVDKDLRRFCLLESARYQHVPRILQNIFLNQSLESRAIKDTLIDSMEFADEGINLNSYRKPVKEFRQKYEDVWKWYKKDSKTGKVKVREDADKVIERYGAYENLRREVALLSGRLRYALRRDEEALPGMQADSLRAQEEKERNQRLLNEENDKYQVEFKKATLEEGALKDFLDKVKAKRNHYHEIGIEEIARRMEAEPQQKRVALNLEKQEQALTDKQTDITTKYDKLKLEQERGLLELRAECQQRKQAIEGQYIQDVDRIKAACNTRCEEVRSRQSERLEALQEEKNGILRQRGELQAKKLKVDLMNPQEATMQELADESSRLREEQAILRNEVNEAQREIDRITHEIALSRKDLENECKADLQGVDRCIEEAHTELEQVESLLKRQDGSLIQWLERNVEGWENHLGKVLDEAEVLYSSALYPQLTDAESADTFCGVKLQVDNLERKVRTPEMMRSDVQSLTERIEGLHKEKDVRRARLADDIQVLEAKPQTTLKRLRMELINKDARLTQIPLLLQETAKRQVLAEKDLKEWRNQEKEQISLQQQQLDAQLLEWDQRKLRLVNTAQKELEKLQKEVDRQVKALNEERRKQTDAVDATVSDASRKAEEQQREWARMRDEELRGSGVDMERLKEIRQELEQVRDELRFIDRNRREYMVWLNDRKEYFEAETAKQDRLKQVKAALDDLKAKYEQRRQKLVQAVNRSTEEVNKWKMLCDRFTTNIAHVKDFMAANETSVPVLAEAHEKSTHEQLDKLLEDLRNRLQNQRNLFDSFKTSVQNFKQNFSAQNYFHFRAELNSDEDFMDYAAELNEFISNQKIEDYRVRTSQDYAYILQRISREVGDLQTHRGQIANTIHDINKDFRENNFAGVIKDIELRDQPSNDRMMQLLLNIKSFNDENLFNVGEANLFSDERAVADANERAVKLLMAWMDQMDAEPKRDSVTLADTFKLEFKVRENDNDTNWVEKLSNVGSDGTDILVKAMVNIMLINVFKRKASRKFGDYKLHCMMDEIGKLHPNNVEGILDFANKRNIYLINSSPTTYNAEAYRYTYTLSKDAHNQTVVRTLLTVR